MRFSPSLHNVDPSTWRMHKLGQPISPLDVILNGSQSQHAVSFEGVTVLSKDHSEQLSIRWVARYMLPWSIMSQVDGLVNGGNHVGKLACNSGLQLQNHAIRCWWECVGSCTASLLAMTH